LNRLLVGDRAGLSLVAAMKPMTFGHSLTKCQVRRPFPSAQHVAGEKFGFGFLALLALAHLHHFLVGTSTWPNLSCIPKRSMRSVSDDALIFEA